MQRSTRFEYLRCPHDHGRLTVDPALPLELARARRQTEEAFAGLPQDSLWLEEGSSFGLVGAGLAGLARWLKEQS